MARLAEEDAVQSVGLGNLARVVVHVGMGLGNRLQPLHGLVIGLVGLGRPVGVAVELAQVFQNRGHVHQVVWPGRDQARQLGAQLETLQVVRFRLGGPAD